MRWDEDVARDEKVCPMTLRIGDDGRSRSRKCFGSDCMAWRGTPAVTAKVRTNLKGERAKATVTKQSIGYCGMAGLPE